jgi:Gas vesicle protein
VSFQDPVRTNRLPDTYRADVQPTRPGPANLADILERVLDKGIVIAGDIQVNLLDIELLTIKLRLLVASVDRAREMGINWWESDSYLSLDAQNLERENHELRARVERLERLLPKGQDGGGSTRSRKRDANAG